jgi:hypothetical protein
MRAKSSHAEHRPAASGGRVEYLTAVVGVFAHIVLVVNHQGEAGGPEHVDVWAALPAASTGWVPVRSHKCTVLPGSSSMGTGMAVRTSRPSTAWIWTSDPTTRSRRNP